MVFLLLVVLAIGMSSDLVAGERTKESNGFLGYFLKLNNDARKKLRKNSSITFNIVPPHLFRCENYYRECLKVGGKKTSCINLKTVCEEDLDSFRDHRLSEREFDNIMKFISLEKKQNDTDF